MTETITKRVDKIARIPAERLATVLPAPKSVKIELTGRCNYRCGFCALATRDEQPKTDMDFELFKRITAEMRDAGVQEIGVFFIGESFVNTPLLVAAIKHVKQTLRIPYCFLTSNASLATRDKVVACMEAGLDSLKWSVNASDEYQFKEVMGVSPIMMQKCRQNIRDAAMARNTLNSPCRIYASSIRYDDAQHERMKIMLERDVLPYVDEHYWLPLYSMGSLATRREGQLGMRPTAGNIGRFDNPVDPLPCWSCFTEGHVLSDGRLSACCFDATGEWVMSDLKTTPFMDAWNSLAFQQLREAHLNKDVTGTQCENCIAIKPSK